MRLTPHDYSPSVLGKIVRSAAREPSFREAAEAMADLAEVTISGRQLGRIAQEVGQQLQACRDHYVIQFQTDALEPRVATRPALAVVEVNGGRLQIRGEGEGPGAHEASWREDKIAILATMTHVVSTSDPEPELPDCFRDRGFVEKVIGAIGGDGSMGPSAASSEVSFDRPRPLEPPTPRTGPELAVRTYVASTCPSDQFGPMVAAEARRRNFTEAAAQAFLGDGSAWIWSLQASLFPTFVPIVNFLHALGHVFAAAKAATTDTTSMTGVSAETPNLACDGWERIRCCLESRSEPESRVPHLDTQARPGCVGRARPNGPLTTASRRRAQSPCASTRST